MTPAILRDHERGYSRLNRPCRLRERSGRRYLQTMVVMAIVGALIAALASYALVSYRDRSLVNVLTPRYLIVIPAHFVIELIVLRSYGLTASTFAYVFVYTTYALQDLTVALAYCCWPRVALPFATVRRQPYRLLGVVLVLAAWAVYAPVLLAYRDYVFSPRAIYTTEIAAGYGPLFFISDLLANLAFALILLWRGRPRGMASFGFVACTLLAVLHGSKGQMLLPFFQAMIFYVYGSNRRVGPVRFLGFAGGFAGGMTLLFVFTLGVAGVAFSNLEGWNASDLIDAVAQYSDYNRNAMLVIDEHMDPTYGRLTYENQVYSRIPRSLFPEKPKNLGSLWLDDQFYPYQFAFLAGRPDFGIGVQYADFNILAMPYLVLWAALTGVFLRVAVDRFRASGSPGAFIMLLFFADVPLISIGATLYPLPEHLLLGLALNFGLRLTLGAPRPAPQLALVATDKA